LITNREGLIAYLKTYSSQYPNEAAFIPRFLKLLEHPRSFHRDHLPGHITASSWIVDDSGKFVLLTHHAKLNRWLQPGGHADGDEDVTAVATREAQEETGLKSIHLVTPDILDIDIHPIPMRKDFPEHDHYDVRFLFKANRNERFIVTEESHGLAWVNIGDIAPITGNNASMTRMAEKRLKLF
jgi:8-oxo-dGTP pyrophosphatase MutT (NUDIX family)